MRLQLIKILKIVVKCQFAFLLNGRTPRFWCQIAYLRQCNEIFGKTVVYLVNNRFLEESLQITKIDNILTFLIASYVSI